MFILANIFLRDLTRCKFIFSLLFIILLSFISAKAQKHNYFPKNRISYTVSLLSVNSPDDDYYALPYRKGIVFCSTRNKDKGIIYNSYTTKKPFTDLYYTENIGEENWKKPEPFSKSINTNLNEGPFTFNSYENVIYYTANEITKKYNSENENILKIYKAELLDNEWKNIEPLSFNNQKYGIGHPSLSPDGKKIFFVSNKPGGYGGSDIYVSYQIGGRWSNPINLGAQVNTSGNELFPFIFEDSTLYFASDKHPGLGKLDIFSATNNKSQWGNVQNIGSPINTKDDDFAYTLEKNGTVGYLSSNREGTDDNIYRFEKIKPACDSVIEKLSCFKFFEKSTLPDEKLPLAYEWDLGDGTKQRGLEVTHCYQAPGIYKTQLNIIDSITGHVFFNEATYEIVVEQITEAYFETNNDFHNNNLVHFDASKSNLPKSKINEYIWNFGDGNTSLGQKVSHEFENLGIYEVSLMVEGKRDSTNSDFSSCVYKKFILTEPEDAEDNRSLITDIGKTLHTTRGEENLVYKVQLTTSDKPIPLTSEKFKGLDKVNEYQKEGIYGYVLGEENDLLSAYPLYNDIIEKGFTDAQVVAFKDGKLFSQIDTSKVLHDAFTSLSGRIINRFGDPLIATIVVENLTTGKIITKIKSDSLEGKFQLTLPNAEIYGYYAQLDGYYSISNFIDLKQERRNLDIKKNIEMIAFDEFNEENLSIRINNLFFETNEYNLSKESYPELKRLAKLIKIEHNLKVEISGHTDNVGEAEKNLILSQRRADEVKNYLVTIGCKKESIISIGYGLTRPLVNNDTDRGKYLNRRVEFKFIKGK